MIKALTRWEEKSKICDMGRSTAREGGNPQASKSERSSRGSLRDRRARRLDPVRLSAYVLFRLQAQARALEKELGGSSRRRI